MPPPEPPAFAAAQPPALVHAAAPPPAAVAAAAESRPPAASVRSSCVCTAVHGSMGAAGLLWRSVCVSVRSGVGLREG